MPPGIRVLHVDDEPEFADLTATFLERENEAFTVVTETAPGDALDRLATDEIDCVVSDYDMPGMDGLEFLEHVRDRHPDLPFVLFTGKGSEEIASEAVSAGVTDYLQKGGTEQYPVLANRIVNVVTQYRAEGRAENQERILTVIREVNQALVRASTRSEIEHTVCDVFAESEPYTLAWIGGYDPEREQIVPRTAVGIDGDSLETVATTPDDGSSEAGAVAGAIGAREVRVTQRGEGDPTIEPWDPGSFDHAYRAAAAVPLVHDDEVYGLLVVYADQPAAFDEAERGMLTELGDDIAHAIHAVEVRRALEQHRTIVENVPEGVFILDEEGTIVTANDGAAELVGHPREDLLDEPFLTLVEDGVFDPGTVERYLEIVRDLLSSEIDREEGRFETEIRPVGGDPRTVEIHVALRPFREEFRGTVGVIRDITAYTRREAELRKSVRRFEAVFDDPDSFTGLLEPDGTLLRANAAALEFIDADPDEVEGEPFWETPWWTHSSALQTELRGWIERAAAGEYVRFEADHYGPDGEKVVINGALRPVTTDDDEVVSIIAEGRDVSERKERERELERQRERYRRLSETSPAPIAIFDADGRIDYANAAAAELVDADDPDALVGESVLEFVHPDERPAAEACIERTIDGPESIARDEWTLVGTGGEVKHTIVAGSPITHRGRSAVQIVLSDVTEQKRRERELERHNERLDAFASMVSHDLRSPLNIATGRIELAREECDCEHLDRADEALDRMDALIDDLLALARRDGDVDDVEPVRLGEIAHGCWDVVGTPAADLRIEADVELVADEGQLRRMFENLFRNAVEHGGDDVTVRIGTLDDGFYVEDDGPGIPEDERELAFEPGRSTADDGTGFGLTIVREIVASHGWEIAVRDGSAGGARFEVTGVGTG